MDNYNGVQPNESIASLLYYGEEVLWCGQPDINKKYTRFDIFLVPYGILWFGFSICWTVFASLLSIPFGLFGIPFTVLGYYLCIGRFIYKRKNKLHTHYLVTDRRIIIYNDYKRVKVNDIPLSRACRIAYTEDKNGIGNLHFGEIERGWLGRYAEQYTNTGLDWLTAADVQSGFFDVDNVREVYDIIKKAVDGDNKRQQL